MLKPFILPPTLNLFVYWPFQSQLDAVRFWNSMLSPSYYLPFLICWSFRSRLDAVLFWNRMLSPSYYLLSSYSWFIIIDLFSPDSTRSDSRIGCSCCPLHITSHSLCVIVLFSPDSTRSNSGIGCCPLHITSHSLCVIVLFSPDSTRSDSGIGCCPLHITSNIAAAQNPVELLSEKERMSIIQVSAYWNNSIFGFYSKPQQNGLVVGRSNDVLWFWKSGK